MAALRKSDPAIDMHAGENETSLLLYLRPDLVKIERATGESGEDQKRLSLPGLYSGIWWYARFPNHYAGEGAKATRDLGQGDYGSPSRRPGQGPGVVKADYKTPAIQKEYFDRVLK